MIKKYIQHLYVFALLLCMAASNSYSNTQTIERIIWDKKPIPILLNIHEERLVHFPVDVRYWMPDSLEKSISILSANGVLYIQAHEAFDKTRIRVQDIETQKTYLLDLISDTEKPAISQEVIISDAEHTENKAKNADTPIKQGDWFVRLTRFAAQSLYAPERLMPADSEITRVKINSLNTVPLIRGGDIEAIPVNSWQGGGLYVTAVLIKNLSAHPIPIQLEQQNAAVMGRALVLANDLRGQWLAVVPQHSYLESAGNDTDRTTLYLLSRQPFGASF